MERITSINLRLGDTPPTPYDLIIQPGIRSRFHKTLKKAQIFPFLLGNYPATSTVRTGAYDVQGSRIGSQGVRPRNLKEKFPHSLLPGGNSPTLRNLTGVSYETASSPFHRIKIKDRPLPSLKAGQKKKNLEGALSCSKPANGSLTSPLITPYIKEGRRGRAQDEAERKRRGILCFHPINQKLFPHRCS